VNQRWQFNLIYITGTHSVRWPHTCTIFQKWRAYLNQSLRLRPWNCWLGGIRRVKSCVINLQGSLPKQVKEENWGRTNRLIIQMLENGRLDGDENGWYICAGAVLGLVRNDLLRVAWDVLNADDSFPELETVADRAVGSSCVGSRDELLN